MEPISKPKKCPNFQLLFDTHISHGDILYLAGLIGNVAKNPLMTRIMFLQAEDKDCYFNDTSLLRELIEFKIIDGANYRVLTSENDPLLSVHELLTAIFCSGPVLSFEFLFKIMPFVNEWSPSLIEEDGKPRDTLPSEYVSGKNLWIHASPFLRRLLDTLDDTVVHQGTCTIKPCEDTLVDTVVHQDTCV